ncbi:MAG: rhodanese-related sulfurtransferase [Bacteroidia bacterium]|jgi:rhodanese-related sulfurtransferase
MKALIIIATSFIGLIACQSAQPNGTDLAAVAQQDVAVQNLKQSDLSAKIDEPNVVLVDVRTPVEVAQGYIQGATVFIDFYSDGFQDEVKKLDTTKTYVMYCRSGGRSGKAAQFMVDNGYTVVYNLAGGITNYSGEVVK